MTQFRAYNGPAPTTAAPTRVATGTSIKTLLQIATPSTKDLEIVEWGISFDGTTASDAPVKVELIQTDVAATVTAHVAAGVIPWDDPNGPASLVTLGTSATGYTATVEGSTTASRMLDYADVTPYGGLYRKEFSLGARPKLPVSKFLRVRVTAAATVNAVCFVTWAE